MNIKQKTDKWIRDTNPGKGEIIALWALITSYMSFMIGLVFGAITDPTFTQWLRFMFIVELVLQPFAISWMVMAVNSRNKFKYFKLGKKFSALESPIIKLIKYNNVHYLTWCACKPTTSMFNFNECVHAEVRIPVDITDPRSQSDAIYKLEKLYSRARKEYEEYTRNEAEVKNRIEEYSRDVNARLLEYNKLNQELSA